MTDKTEAMDNLIAQDADLIDVSSGVTEADREVLIRISNSDDETAQRIRRGLIYTWEVGEIARHRQQATEAQAAEIERLNKSAECLAETRRLAVKDLAVLEEHMRIEIGQWKVDYDCAIRDIEHLRERIEAQAAENERLREALRFYAEAKNWAYVKSAGCNCIDADGGDTASAALEQSK
jgi:NAD-specific glutamate dehydrogenase